MSRPTSDGLTPPSPAERQRLGYDHFGTLAALLNRTTFDHILAFGIGDGWRCWEAGAGGDSVPRWLAEQAGPSGYVLASDIDVSVLDETRDRPFDVRRHDLTTDPPPTGGFNLVQARLVLEHLPDPSVALTTLAAALRPEGWLLVESSDPKLQPLACPDEVEPRHALANKLRSALWDLMAQRTQIGLGRALPRLLRDAGLTDVHAEVAFNLGGPDARRMQHALIAWARPALVAAGLAGAREIDQHLADLESADLDIAVFPIVSAWGRKQSGRNAP